MLRADTAARRPPPSEVPMLRDQFGLAVTPASREVTLLVVQDRIAAGRRGASRGPCGRLFSPISLISRGFRHVRPFKMGVNQAQERRRGRQARQGFHAPHQGIDGCGPGWRRRPRHEPAASHDHRGRQAEQHARRQHQARDSPGHRRRAGRVVRRGAVPRPTGPAAPR